MPHFFPFLLLAASAIPLLAQSLDFQRDIRPILSDNCFQCHGPDQSTRMVGLRLDTKEGAMSERKSGRAVIPGDPRASLLVQRIAHEKEAMRMPPVASHKMRMPPVASHKKLTDAQKDLLRRWIEQGAPWKEHWAFVPPARPEVPRIEDARVRNPIDRFVLAKLKASNLDLNPEAGRRTLIRRVSFDLTGLPPKPAEVEAFVKDTSPDAYERLADRLMSSPHYGEHRARYWLDAARYGDTHGIHHDNYREIWPYRDWVIQAFNRNLPFDRFTVEQIAGDLLPNRTLEQQIASGFHRCNVTTSEGGSITEEVEAMYAKDRVETTATVWLGMTVGCASCHDHKFDPILQKDFYRLAAFFRNTTQKAMDGNISDTPPVILVTRPEDALPWQTLRAEVDRLRKQEAERRAAAVPDMEKWLAGVDRSSLARPLHRETETMRLDIATLPGGLTAVEGPMKALPAVQFGKAGIAVPSADLIAASKPFTISTWIRRAPQDDNVFLAGQFQSAGSSIEESEPRESRGWILEMIGGRLSLCLTAGNKGWIQANGSATKEIKPGQWAHLAIAYDGSRRVSGLSVYIDGKPFTVKGQDYASIDPSGDLRTGLPLQLGGDGKKGHFTGGAISDFRIYPRALSREEAESLSLWPAVLSAGASAKQREALTQYYLNHHDRAYIELAGRLAAMENDLQLIRSRAATTVVMQEKSDSMPVAKVLYRGQYDQPKESVDPGVPSVLPQMSGSLPKNRLGLAQWLIDPVNPLPARVTVNRYWQELFGSGLVRTSEDFGSQGEPPSHPELLDWLAVEFRESGWDVKKLIRLMVTSAAYRQSAAATGEKLRSDPANRLLSRGPRFRLDAEGVRDMALASSGLLDPDIGGPSVRPYQPDGIWKAVAMKASNTRFYPQDHGDSLYRRSLYTFWKRSAPPASMDIFNAPSRENCTVRRERTNTPLQALVTMNDPQFVEASRHMAQRALRESSNNFDAQIDFITANVLSRPFDVRERSVSWRTLQDLITHYDKHPAEAAKLLAVGESKADASLSKPEFAAWTMVASQVMNLDEALNK